jgi:hypothetical protein
MTDLDAWRNRYRGDGVKEPGSWTGVFVFGALALPVFLMIYWHQEEKFAHLCEEIRWNSGMCFESN